MVAAYGVVLTAVSGFLMTVGTLLVYAYRREPFIKCRNPTMLIIQNVGIMISALTTSLYIALRPHYSCYVYYFGSLFVFSGFAYPLGIRYVEYCVNFHVSKVRSQYRENTMVANWGKEDWFFRNRWIISPRTLNIAYFVGFWIWLVPMVPYFFLRGQFEYSSNGGCSVYNGGIYVVPILALVFFIAAIFLAALTWGSRDAYYIKHEMGVNCLIWVIVVIVLLVYTIVVSDATQKKLSSSFWSLIGLYSSFVCCNFFPLFLAYRDRKLRKHELIHSKFKDFALLLEDLNFRNAFLDFLATQFCQENILFYMAVQEWKRMDMSDPARIKTARSIHENYVLESGNCQVNIAGRTREELTVAIAQDDIPRDAFDNALTEVLTMVHENSYLQFKTSKLYANAKV